ncbi:MAG: NHL repeat-containing protein [Actinomycetes bacterium]|nr:NHL repeat-containing protein [Actinomycetes bacterium]
MYRLGHRSTGRLLPLIIILIILLLLMLALLALTLTLGSGDSPFGSKASDGLRWMRSIYGFGQSADELMNPTSVAVTPGGGSFWVTDPAHYRLLRYNWFGSIERVVTQDATGTPFQYPSAIALSPDGWLYVAQQTYNQVRVYDKDLNLQATISQMQPSALAVNDHVLVVGGRGGFSAYRPDGTLIGSIGRVERGTGADEFDYISGLVLDDDDAVYVLDAYNNRLSKYDAAGDKLWMVNLGRPGNGGMDAADRLNSGTATDYPAGLQTPVGLTRDTAGRLIVIDSQDFSISAFSAADGAYLGKKWGDFGEEDGKLAYPSAIAYNSSRNQFVLTEPQLGRAQIIEVDGSGANLLNSARGRFGPLLAACCVPLLIVLLLLALYLLWRRHRRRHMQSTETV